MIRFIKGMVRSVESDSATIEMAGLGLKIFTSKAGLRDLTNKVGLEVCLYCHLKVKEDGLDLYGFLSDEELSLFNLLNSVSGVGPKSALSIMNVATLKELKAAISEKRIDLLVGASGVGRRTAERIALELSGKISVISSDVTVSKMEGDRDILETLVGLGYRKEEARAAISQISSDVSVDVGSRLKAALKILSIKKK